MSTEISTVLTADHRAYLNAAGLTDEYLDSTAIRSVTPDSPLPDEFHNLPDETAQSGILFPWTSTDGEVSWQFRPDTPQVVDGRAQKYIFPAGAGTRYSVVHAAPGAQRVLIVEGTKQSHAAAAAIQFATQNLNRFSADSRWLRLTTVIGIPGAWGWRDHGTMPHALRSLCSANSVTIVLDADAETNLDVYTAGDKMKGELTTATEVRFAQLPGGGKSGLDDHLSPMSEVERGLALVRLVELALLTPSAKKPVRRAPADAPIDLDSFSPFDSEGRFRPVTTARYILMKSPVAITQDDKLAVYRDGVYKFDEHRIKSLLVGLMGDAYSVTALTNVTSALKGLCADRGLYLPDRAERALMNCQNGMVDLATGERLPHDPKYLSTRQVPVIWDAHAECPFYESWVLDRVGESQVNVLEETLAQLLDPSRAPSRAAFLFGPSRSGKSTTSRILAELAGGREYISAVTLQMLSDNRFAAAELYGKTLNTAADIPASHVRDLSAFKMMTGDDPITGDKKNGNMFVFRNQALFLFSANTVPSVSESSQAYVARVNPIAFPKTYLGKEDPTVEDRLLAELPGILVRLVKAHQRRMTAGRWSAGNPAVVEQFAAQSDRVARFIQAACRVGVTEVPEGVSFAAPGGYGSGPQSKKALYKAFTDWSESEGSAAMGEKSFTNRLLTLPGVAEVRVGTERKRALNVEVLPQDEWGDGEVDLIAALFPELARTCPDVSAGQGVIDQGAGKSGKYSQLIPTRGLEGKKGTGGVEGFASDQFELLALTAREGTDTPSDQAKQAGKYGQLFSASELTALRMVTDRQYAALFAAAQTTTADPFSFGLHSRPTIRLTDLAELGTISADRLKALLRRMQPQLLRAGISLHEHWLEVPGDLTSAREFRFEDSQDANGKRRTIPQGADQWGYSVVTTPSPANPHH